MDYTEKIAVFRKVKVRTECGKHIVTTPYFERVFDDIVIAFAYAYGAANAHF